jgi:hypothetical protein
VAAQFSFTKENFKCFVLGGKDGKSNGHPILFFLTRRVVSFRHEQLNSDPILMKNLILMQKKKTLPFYYYFLEEEKTM